jgi:hypothetical protein
MALPFASSTVVFAVASYAQSPFIAVLNCAKDPASAGPEAYARVAPFASACAASNSAFGASTGTTAKIFFAGSRSASQAAADSTSAASTRSASKYPPAPLSKSAPRSFDRGSTIREATSSPCAETARRLIA